jgi:hypothetical protein
MTGPGAYTLKYITLWSRSFHIKIYRQNCCCKQREGIGLLEYHAMPFLRDGAHDGVLFSFSNRSAPGWDKWFGLSDHTTCPMERPSCTKSQPCWVTLLQPARLAAVLSQPSSLQSHWSTLSPVISLLSTHDGGKLSSLQWRHGYLVLKIAPSIRPETSGSNREISHVFNKN